jgi:hypothetical protein
MFFSDFNSRFVITNTKCNSATAGTSLLKGEPSDSRTELHEAKFAFKLQRREARQGIVAILISHGLSRELGHGSLTDVN